MSKYELTCVLPGKSTPAKVKTFQEKFEKAVKLLKGNIDSSKDWGKDIDLAYKINKNSSGIFYTFDLELEESQVSNLNNKLKTEPDVIRYLLIRKYGKKSE